MNMVNDLALFFSDFGVPAVLSQPGQPDKPVEVLFSLNSLDVVGTLTDKPQIVIRDTDLDGVEMRDAGIVVTGKYPAAKITKPTPDGSGLTTALLTRI